MLLPATPGWVSVPVVVCGPPPLLAGVRWRRWCVVCGVWCVVCGVWCVVCGRGVLVGLRLVCGVVGSSPLPAEVPVCYSPPLLAGFRCRRWWAFLATPGRGSRARFPATPGWVSLSAVVCGVWCVVCGVWRVACGGGVCGGFVAGVTCGWSLATPGGGSCVLLPATPGCVSLPVVVWGSPPLLAGARRLWWCVSRAGVSFVVCVCGVCGCARWPCCVVCCVFVVSVFFRGAVWWCGGCVFRVPFPLALVCVCALCGPSCWCGWRGGGGVVRGAAVVRASVCARGVWLVGWGVSYLGWFSSSVVGMFQKAEEEVL